jgi:hypothetical protein
MTRQQNTAQLLTLSVVSGKWDQVTNTHQTPIKHISAKILQHRLSAAMVCGGMLTDPIAFNTMKYL